MALFGKKILHFDDALKTAFSEAGFDCYDRLVLYREGKRVSRAHKRVTRKIELSVEGSARRFYIKQAGAEPFNRVWKSIRKGRVPCSSVLHEVRMLKFLEEQGLPVMRAVGWGEKLVFGWPVSGFLLLEEVRGKEFVELFNTSGHLLRKKMMRAYGALAGDLHRKGINSRVRPRDIICISNDFSDYLGSLVLIDRERGTPSKVDMPIEKCAAQLAPLLTKSIQNIGIPKQSEVIAFLVGYFSVNQAFYKDRFRFIDIAVQKMRDLLEEHERYRDIRQSLLTEYRLN